MRLSDAIAMGRMLVKPRRVFASYDGKYGCALGMAMAAVGKPLNECAQNQIESICKEWPWINSTTICAGQRPIKQIMQAFDGAVHSKRMTLDQLIDWVRNVEPAEQEQLSTDTAWFEEVSAETVNAK